MVECLTPDQIGVGGSSLTRGTVLGPWARHFILCLVLVQLRKTCPVTWLKNLNILPELKGSNFCLPVITLVVKQFGQKVQLDVIFPNKFLKTIIFTKFWQTTKKYAKLPNMQKVKIKRVWDMVDNQLIGGKTRTSDLFYSVLRKNCAN